MHCDHSSNRCILKTFRGSKVPQYGTLALANSLMCLMAPGFKPYLISLCDRNSIHTEDISLSLFIETHSECATVNCFDIRSYQKLSPSHYIFGAGLFFTLIGKSLKSNNYQGWMNQRLKSFSKPLGLSITDNKLVHLRPSLQIASHFYEEMRVYWDLRALHFGMMWSMSRDSDLKRKRFLSSH